MFPHTVIVYEILDIIIAFAIVRNTSVLACRDNFLNITNLCPICDTNALMCFVQVISCEKMTPSILRVGCDCITPLGVVSVETG